MCASKSCRGKNLRCLYQIQRIAGNHFVIRARPDTTNHGVGNWNRRCYRFYQHFRTELQKVSRN